MQGPLGSDTCRVGVKSGESTIREVAAFLLDHDGFAGVPQTQLINLKHQVFGEEINSITPVAKWK
jgi:hypothetical protein